MQPISGAGWEPRARRRLRESSRPGTGECLGVERLIPLSDVDRQYVLAWLMIRGPIGCMGSLIPLSSMHSTGSACRRHVFP